MDRIQETGRDAWLGKIIPFLVLLDWLKFNIFFHWNVSYLNTSAVLALPVTLWSVFSYHISVLAGFLKYLHCFEIMVFLRSAINLINTLYKSSSTHNYSIGYVLLYNQRTHRAFVQYPMILWTSRLGRTQLGSSYGLAWGHSHGCYHRAFHWAKQPIKLHSHQLLVLTLGWAMWLKQAGLGSSFRGSVPREQGSPGLLRPRLKSPPHFYCLLWVRASQRPAQSQFERRLHREV